MRLTTLLLALSIGPLAAQPLPPQQNEGPGSQGGQQQGQPGMAPGGGHRPPPPPIIGAIDADHNGVISSDEMQNAAQALQSLDANGDGQLTPDEFCGRPPQGGRRGQGGPNRGQQQGSGPQTQQ
jgi:hypothetical protein